MGIPKALVPVLGESLLLRAVRGLLGSGSVHAVVIAAPGDQVDPVRRELAEIGSAVCVVPGGAERTDSVRLALAEAQRFAPNAGIALVHDAARAFTPASVITNVVDAVARGAAGVVPVLPVSDTIKELDSEGAVLTTVDRSRLATVQTPQGFDIDVLRDAYERCGDLATDDAGLAERAGYRVRTVAGHQRSLKITTSFDLAIAESVLALSDPEDPVIGATNRCPGSDSR